jgi:transcriptional regulator with XRE-family HTH domain
MSFDYSKLRGRIVEKCGTLENFAKAAEISSHTISRYLNNKIPWKQTNINTAIQILDIPPEEIPTYFFKPKVQNLEHEEEEG